METHKKPSVQDCQILFDSLILQVGAVNVFKLLGDLLHVSTICFNKGFLAGETAVK